METIQNYKPINAEWLEDLTQFNTFLTITCRGGDMPLKSLVRMLSEFYKRNLPDATIFTAYEPHANGIGYHAHSMARIPRSRVTELTSIKQDGKPTYCRKLWRKLHRKFGRSSVSEIKDQSHVTNYCQKRVFDYATKDNQAVFALQFGSSAQCRRDYLSAKSDPVAYPTL